MSQPGLSAQEEFTKGFGLLALRSGQYLFLFLAGLVVARSLGPVGRAQYALPLAAAAVAQLVAYISLENAVGRLLARREASLHELTRFLSVATLVVSALAMAITVGVGELAGRDLLAGADTGTVLVAAATIPGSVATQSAGGLLSRLGKLKSYGRVMAGSSAVQLAIVLVLEAAGSLTPRSALAAVAIGWAICATGLILALARETGKGAFVPATTRSLAGRAVRIGIALQPATLGLFLHIRIDLFLVSALTDARQTGLYSLATSLAEFVFLASWTIGIAAMRAQTQETVEVASRYTVEFVRQAAMLAAVLAAVTAASAYPFVRFVYGKEWVDSVLPLVILTFAAVALAVEGPIRALLVRIARPRVVSIAAVAGLAANVGLNLMLIPPLGIPGAAIASVLSYAAYALLTLRLFATRADVSLGALVEPPRSDDVVVCGLRRLAGGFAGRRRSGTR